VPATTMWATPAAGVELAAVPSVGVKTSESLVAS
jgi:hypothetical protein